MRGIGEPGSVEPSSVEPSSVETVAEATTPNESSVWKDPTSRTARLAVVAFSVYLTVAFFVLVRLGRNYWFYSDDFGLLVRRWRSGDGLFRPQNGHWSTFPLLAYHFLYWAFGLNYGPFQVCTILMHLTLAVLLRVIMRRAGVGPWFATITASVFVLFGPGSENILLSVQISMVGSLLFGIGHLLCADHDGPFTRRDAAGLVCGALALTASGVGTIMVIIVGFAVLFRRGWRMAALHTAPLAVMYGAWYQAERNWLTIPFPDNPLKYAFQWNLTGERGVFVAIGNYREVAIALAVLLVVGLVIAWRPLDLAELRRRASAPAALLLGAPTLFAIVSSQRYWAGNAAASSRYVSMATAFTLPALAVAAQAVARHWRRIAPVVGLLIVSAIPANIGKFPEPQLAARLSPNGLDFHGPIGRYAYEKQITLGIAYSPLVDHVSRKLQPQIASSREKDPSVGFLVDARDSGRLPPPPALTTSRLDEVVVRLGVEQLGAAPPAHVVCRRYDDALVLYPAKGAVYVLRESVAITYRPPDGTVAAGGVVFAPSRGKLLVIQVSGLELHVARAPAPFPARPVVRPFTFCE
ncbi:MAG TPA: hypothetical protein VIK54_03750 [Acidimicrobiia bacterium]